ISDLFGETLAEVAAPETGFLLWRMTHPTIPKGSTIGAVAVEEQLIREMHVQIASDNSPEFGALCWGLPGIGAEGPGLRVRR
ncbi:hypothetical protein D3227_40585, partial [Mesorhizobium waimense]